MSARTTPGSLIRRPARAVPVGILAVALLAAGGMGVWLLGTYLAEGTWPPSASGAIASVGDTSLDATVVRVVAIGLAVVASVLLLAALVPGRPSRVRVLDGDVPGETALSRRDLARRIQRRAENVDGVYSTSVEVTRRRIDVLVRTVVDDTAPVLQAASVAVDRAVHALRPAAPARPRVRIHRRN